MGVGEVCVICVVAETRPISFGSGWLGLAFPSSSLFPLFMTVVLRMSSLRPVPEGKTLRKVVIVVVFNDQGWSNHLRLRYRSYQLDLVRVVGRIEGPRKGVAWFSSEESSRARRFLGAHHRENG